MIKTEGLTKKYGGTIALRDLDLEIRKGEVLGLLGPNGSGKTTMIRLILGLLRATSGQASVAGHDSWRDSLRVRELVAYLPGELRMFGSMTGLTLLKFLSSLRGGAPLERAVDIAERIMALDLSRKVRNYSTGMKQKLALAQIFADPVEVIILDEPTSALDPSARQDVLKLVADARDRGQTVILSGHVLSEVEQVADRVAIMRRGRLMHVEDMRERKNVRIVRLRYPEEGPRNYPSELKLVLKEHRGQDVLLEHRGEVAPLISWLDSQPVVDLTIGALDLRSLYDIYHGPCVSDGGD